MEGNRAEKFLGKQKSNLAMFTLMQKCVEEKLNGIEANLTSLSKPNIKLRPSGITFIQKWVTIYIWYIR